MGSDLYEQVFYSLDLIEKDYFGLQFTDANNVQHWLDATKVVKKQVKSKQTTWTYNIAGERSSREYRFHSVSSLAVGPPYTFRLKVKFYSPEPNTLREELTRYQFFLQLKADLLDGRLECDQPKAIELCSLALQCE